MTCTNDKMGLLPENGGRLGKVTGDPSWVLELRKSGDWTFGGGEFQVGWGVLATPPQSWM